MGVTARAEVVPSRRRAPGAASPSANPAFTATHTPVTLPTEPPRFIVQNGHLVPNPALAKR